MRSALVTIELLSAVATDAAMNAAKITNKQPANLVLINTPAAENRCNAHAKVKGPVTGPLVKSWYWGRESNPHAPKDTGF